jgi:hypothetical protein
MDRGLHGGQAHVACARGAGLVLFICSGKAAAQRLLQRVYCVGVKSVDVAASDKGHDCTVHPLQLAFSVVLMVKQRVAKSAHVAFRQIELPADDE